MNQSYKVQNKQLETRFIETIIKEIDEDSRREERRSSLPKRRDTSKISCDKSPIHGRQIFDF